MNYERIYCEFIADRRAKEAALLASGVYVERHHILPKSLGGSNHPSNLIALTAGDHFFAHLCLAKWLGEEQWLSVHSMSFGADFHDRAELISKRHWFQHARIAASAIHSANTSRLHKNPKWAAKLRTDEVNRKRSETMKAYCASPIWANHELKRLAAIKTPEARANKSAAMLKMWQKPKADKWREEKAKMCAARNKDPEFIKKHLLGDNHPRKRNPEKWANAALYGEKNPAKRPEIRTALKEKALERNAKRKLYFELSGFTGDKRTVKMQEVEQWLEDWFFLL